MRLGRKDYTGDQASKEPRDQATKEPRDQASKEPRDQATKEPRAQADRRVAVLEDSHGPPGSLVPWICCEGLCSGLPGPLVAWFLGPLAWELGDQGPDGHQDRTRHHCDTAP